jgi:hypothetical protein
MDEFVTSVRTLLTFVGNVVAHPAEAKYRRIRMNNANFQLRLGRHRGRGHSHPASHGNLNLHVCSLCTGLPMLIRRALLSGPP